jgi:hypothetical protein
MGEIKRKTPQFFDEYLINLVETKDVVNTTFTNDT